MEKLKITYNKDKGLWELNLENATELCKKFIEENELANVVITNDADYDLIYSQRTILNNKNKEISTLRKQMVKTLTGDFIRNCKEIEKMIAEASDRMTEKLYAYRPKERKQSIFTIKLSNESESAINKVIKYALKYGCKVEE